MKKVVILLIANFAVVLIIAGVIFFFIIPSSPPPTISESVPIGLTNDPTPQFSFISSGAGTISYVGDCKSSTTSAVKGTNLITFNNLQEGVYDNCQIIITNSLNKQSTIIVPSFTIDTSPPTTTASSNNYINGNFAFSAIINFTCNDSGTGCNGNTRYTINGGVEQTGQSVIFTSTGIYSLEYWNVDKAGNVEAHHTEFNNIKIDRNMPSPKVTTASGYRNKAFDIRYTPSSSSDSCYYEANYGPAQGIGSCLGVFTNVTFSSDREYSIIIYENNSVGNIGNSNTLNITWDTTPPLITISSPVNNGVYNSTTWPGVVLSYADATVCQYSPNNSTWTNFNSCSDTSNYLVGVGTDQTLYARGIDIATNAGSGVSVTFNYSIS